MSEKNKCLSPWKHNESPCYCDNCCLPIASPAPAPAGNVKRSFEQFWDEHAEWSQATFGADGVRGPQGPLNHLAKEVNEALDNPDDVEEYADLLLLAFDATRRAGFSSEELCNAAFSKLAKNKLREWGAPNTDGSVEHVRSPRPSSAGGLVEGPVLVQMELIGKDKEQPHLYRVKWFGEEWLLPREALSPATDGGSDGKGLEANQ